ncbi:nucleotidyltransferase family protein [Acidipila sp. EB88]|uniref:nucleotidyltransferase family protein n=1 Tax=Acidipila sp. EB88 TaxID=2305226 RepID=UPI0035150FE8
MGTPRSASGKNGTRTPGVASAPWSHRDSDHQIREAALLSFCDPIPAAAAELLRLRSSEWRKLLTWLDISGLAVYLLDRLDALEWSTSLPPAVLQGLRRRMAENGARTQSMIRESVAIQEEFQSASISYAVLKGVSFCPSSVPRPELRHQFDLDYLVAEEDVADARRLLEKRGYRLYAVSGKSWEFKANERPTLSIKDLYRASPGYAVELHLEQRNRHGAGPAGRLSRVLHKELYGISMPVLAPVDLFLGQGLHAFKDVCSAFSRTAHLLEFYRHVMTRRTDAAFWEELASTAAEDRRAAVGIGAVVYLLTDILGLFAPPALTSWTVDTLPPRIRLWVDRYGRQTALGQHPGTKLYLLLQHELEVAGLPAGRSSRAALLPSKLPPPVMKALQDEPTGIRIARYRLQLDVLCSRLRFHLLEGARYSLEAYQWRKCLKQHHL